MNVTILYVLFCTLVSAAHYIFRRLDEEPTLANDSHRYLSAGKGVLQRNPFHLRWLLPKICTDDHFHWRVITGYSIIALVPMMFAYLLALGVEPLQALFGALLVPGLGGIFRFNIKVPILVDAPVLLLSLMSATMFLEGHIIVAVLFVIIAGCMKESAPVLTLAFSLNPLALLGFANFIFFKLFKKGAEKDSIGNDVFLDNQLATGIKYHRGVWFHEKMLLPWGVCLLAFFSPVDGMLWLAFALAIGYGMLLAASDTVRIYHQVFPVMIYYTVLVVPSEFYVPLLLVHWFNPWQKYYF